METPEAILAAAVERGEELGCQCAVWRDGEWLCDAAAGWADESRSRPVTPQTLFPVFSIGKAFATTAALRLIDRGFLSLDTRLTELWPEFTGGGKELTRYGEVLSHTTGLFCLPHADTPAELADWPLMCHRLAAMKPAWLSGARTKYQAFTYSWLLGEPLCRATGKTFPEILQDEVLSPLGVEREVFFGLPPSQDCRLAELVRAPDLLPPLPPRPTFWNPTENMLKEPVVRQGCLPAFNGIASAHGLAVLGKALLEGLLSPALLLDATRLHRPATQPIPANPGYWELFGLGYLLYAPAPDRGLVFGHGGYGGAELLIHQRSRTVFAFTKNRLSTSQPLRDALRKHFEMLENH